MRQRLMITFNLNRSTGNIPKISANSHSPRPTRLVETAIQLMLNCRLTGTFHFKNSIWPYLAPRPTSTMLFCTWKIINNTACAISHKCYHTLRVHFLKLNYVLLSIKDDTDDDMNYTNYRYYKKVIHKV